MVSSAIPSEAFDPSLAHAIVNLNGNGGLKANGRYTLFGKFSRTDDQRADNNAVRAELLKALGQAFGLAGMREEGGTFRFSQDFMARLEQILGSKVFKRSDFEVGEDGIVRSGKPLTQRRILAVKARVDRIVAEHVALNKVVVGNFTSGRFERLPQDLKDGLARLTDDLRAVFGAEAVPPGAATFIKTLSVRGGTVKTLPIVDKGRFLAAVEAGADAALAEVGIVDAGVCKKVKDGVRKRAETVLAGASGLKELSDFLAAVRADIVAIKEKQDEMVATYSAGLAQETVPILVKLVSVLDWRPNAAAASEAIVKNYVEDMKAWRNVAAGSPDAKGLEDVLQRRMNDYLKDVLAGHSRAPFNTGAHSGLFQTFLDDLPRCTYVVNGTTVPGTALQERLVPFTDAIKDPAKRKTVSVMVNQQIFGDYTASVGNRIPLSGWKNDMPDEPVDNIPGIGKFASRDLSKTGFQLFDTGPMTFEIDVAPDESTVTVRATCPYPLHADITLPTAFVGTCTVTQEFVIDFTGAEPAIRGLRIGQTLA